MTSRTYRTFGGGGASGELSAMHNRSHRGVTTLAPGNGAPAEPYDPHGSGSVSSRFAYLPLIAMRFTFDCACATFGNVTVSTPFLKAADILSSSTSSTGMRRSKRP
jgi:hypothetical protein